MSKRTLKTLSLRYIIEVNIKKTMYYSVKISITTYTYILDKSLLTLIKMLHTQFTAVSYDEYIMHVYCFSDVKKKKKNYDDIKKSLPTRSLYALVQRRQNHNLL